MMRTSPTSRLVLGTLLCGLLACCAFPGCGTARREEPVAGPLLLSDADPSDAAELRGQRAFMRHCYECHPGGAAGLGPALNDKPLPGFAIRTQVRVGAGAMPAFSQEHVSDQELSDIVAYLIALRRNKPERGTR